MLKETKSDAIRRVLRENPGATPTTNLVSNIKSESKTRNGTIDFQKLRLAAKASREFGGIDGALRALSELELLQV